jgi:hypothetical protein
MGSILSFLEPRNWDNVATAAAPLLSFVPGAQSIGGVLTALQQLQGAAGAGRQIGRIGDQQKEFARLLQSLGVPALQEGINYLSDSLDSDFGATDQNPYLTPEVLGAAMENAEGDFGVGMNAAMRRFGGRGITGSSGLTSAFANQGQQFGAARNRARRDLLVQGNLEQYRRARVADDERTRRASMLTSLGQGLTGQGMGTLGGLQGLYASQMSGYGAGLGQSLSNIDMKQVGREIDGLLKRRRGQAGGTTSPTSTNSQSPSQGVTWTYPANGAYD